MNLKQQYQDWHKKRVLYGWPKEMNRQQYLEVVQFCDDFMEQCDKLEKENAELRKVIDEVIGTYTKPYDLCGGWGDIKSNYVAMENAILKLRIIKEQGE